MLGRRCIQVIHMFCIFLENIDPSTSALLILCSRGSPANEAGLSTYLTPTQ